MTLLPAAVLSPSMMKLSGTTMLEDTAARDGLAGGVGPWTAGSSWAGRRRCTASWSSGRSGPASRSTLRPALLAGILSVAELVLDVRAELDRVGAAELLLREADRELGGHRLRDAVDRDGLGATGVTVICRRDVQRPRIQRAVSPGRWCW